MTPVDPGSGTPGSSDAELLAAVRGRPSDAASTAAFGALYDRHQEAARALARQLARTPSDAEDLVSATFARLLEVLRGGGGPTEAFRAYLLTSLRHLAYDRSRAERRLELTEDIGDVVGVDPERTVVPFADPAVAGLERSLAARAFATLPERWQAVLWHLEVEGDSPAAIAPMFGLTPNAVSALGYRAREGLRQAYLQEHLASESSGSPPRDRRHRETGERLGAYTRGGLSRRDASRVEAHLRECEECRALAEELREVNSGIVRAAVGPTVLGAALVGYLAARGWSGGGEVSSAFPTTGELVVAGGGALGVLGAIGAALRPGVLLPGAGRSGTGGAVAVGLVGVGVAAVGVLGPGSLTPADLPSLGLAPGSARPDLLGPGLWGPGLWGPDGVPRGTAAPGGTAGDPTGAGAVGGAAGRAGGAEGAAGRGGRTGSDAEPVSARAARHAAGGPGTGGSDRTPPARTRSGTGRSDGTASGPTHHRAAGTGGGSSSTSGRHRAPEPDGPGSSAGSGALDPGAGSGGVSQGGAGALGVVRAAVLDGILS